MLLCQRFPVTTRDYVITNHTLQPPLSVVGRQPNLGIFDGSFSAVSTPILYSFLSIFQELEDHAHLCTAPNLNFADLT